MQVLTGTWIRSSVCCGVLAASLVACGRSDRPAAGGDTAPMPAGTSGMAATPAAPATPATGGARIATAQQAAVGSFLTDDKGRSVYLFLKDSAGMSNCYDACAAAWPPVIVTGTPAASDSTVKTDLLGSLQRRDGAMQATYKNAPLYYYEDDKQPGDIKGQNKLEFGARWYLVSPTGDRQMGKAGGKSQ